MSADKYDDMTGPMLAEELSRRELPVSGRVDELRDRLREDDEKRAQASGGGPDDGSESEETEAGEVEVPEQREPIEQELVRVRLDEDQARALTRAEASYARHMRYVFKVEPRKYLPGDEVAAVRFGDDGVVTVLGIGASLALSEDEV